MAVLKTIQSGTLNLTGTSDTVTITSVDTTKAFLLFSTRFAEPSPGTLVSGQVTNGTTLTFTRASSTGTVDIQWYVVEFTSGVSVQRGSHTLDSTEPDDVTITSVDLAKSFPVMSYRKATSSGFGQDDFFKGRLTTSTNLELDMVTGNSTLTVEWQVVEYTGCSVQRGEVALSSTTSVTDTITSVDTAKSWLLFTYKCTTGASANIAQKMVRGAVTNATTLTFDKDQVGSPGVTLDISWILIEFTDDTVVQSASEDFTTGETQQDVTITSVDTARSIASAGAISYTGGMTTLSTDDNPGVASVTLEFTTATNLRLTRALTGSVTADIQWFVVEFKPAVVGFRAEPLISQFRAEPLDSTFRAEPVKA